MGQVLHRGATTTEAIRRAIQHSQESLFGGGGFDADGNSGLLNDLWEFSPSALLWTWMGGNTSACDYGVKSGVWGSTNLQNVCQIEDVFHYGRYWFDLCPG
jgi:hypothetical protein